jgi:hypothetical protein
LFAGTPPVFEQIFYYGAMAHLVNPLNPRFPPDLVRDQQAWHGTYEALAAARPGASTTVLRRRLLWLSRRIAAHPHWGDSRCTTSWAQLRRQAREAAGPPHDGEARRQDRCESR